MTVESIVKYSLDDTDFRRFIKNFNQYQKDLGKVDGLWKQAGKWQDLMGAKVAKVNTLYTANAGMQRLIADSMRKQVVSTTQNERLWGSVARSSGSFAKNIATATKSILSWTGVLTAAGGLLGLGGLFGLDRMAGNIAGQRRSAQGLGLSIGQEKAFGINYGKLVDSGSFLGWINSMEGDISKQGTAFSLTGHGLSGNTSNDAVSMLDSIRALAKRTPLNNLSQIAGAYGIDMSMDQLRRLKEGSDTEYNDIKAGYVRNSKDQNIPDKDAKAWQDFTTQMQRAAGQMLGFIEHALIPLEKPLERLSASLVTAFGKALEKNGVVEQGINTLAGWLDKWNGKISKPEFLKSVESFTSDVGDLAQAIHGLAHPGETLGNAANSAGTAWDRFLNGGAGTSMKIDAAAQANVFKLAAGYGSAFGLPSGLLQSQAWLESRGNVNTPDSAKGAMGVMGLMPSTAAQYHINARDPGQAMRGGALLDQDLIKKYQGDIAKVLAAYNWGQGNLDKDIAAHGANWQKYAPQETRDYVRNGQVAISIFNNTGGSATTAISQLGAM